MKSFLLRALATIITVPLYFVALGIVTRDPAFAGPYHLPPVPHQFAILVSFWVLFAVIWRKHGSFLHRVGAWIAGMLWIVFALLVVLPLWWTISDQAITRGHGIFSLQVLWPAIVFYVFCALADVPVRLILRRPRQQTATGSQSMGFFSNMRLAGRLRKISEALSAPTRGFSNIEGIKEMVARGRQRAAAEEELLDFLEGLEWMSDVKAEYGLDREELRSLFRDIHSGCGQWVRGNYVAASALAIPQTLIYVLEARRRGVPRIEVLYQFLEYFEKGKVESPPLPK